MGLEEGERGEEGFLKVHCCARKSIFIGPKPFVEDKRARSRRASVGHANQSWILRLSNKQLDKRNFNQQKMNGSHSL